MLLKPNIDRITDDLYLITLFPPINGFNDFISAWLYKGDTTFLVDVGPSVTSGGLIDALQSLSIDRLDYILLTHIHIDHAGGIGDISSCFPEAPIICHEKGIPHLADPTRLWEGSVKTLGDTGRAYGPIKPVPLKRLFPVNQLPLNDIKPIITPGHSPHHVSYLADEYLFAGETGGVFLRLPSGEEYLRPATPPKFFMETYLQSIDTLLNITPSKICYGHFGISNNALEQLNKHREQLLMWYEIISDEMTNFNDDGFIENCIQRLLDEDPLLKHFSKLDKAVQEREHGFMRNGINGFAGYLKTSGKS